MLNSELYVIVFIAMLNFQQESKQIMRSDSCLNVIGNVKFVKIRNPSWNNEF